MSQLGKEKMSSFVLLNFVANSRMGTELTEVDQDAAEVGLFITWRDLG